MFSALPHHRLATDTDHVLSTPSPHVSNRFRSCSLHSLTTRSQQIHIMFSALPHHTLAADTDHVLSTQIQIMFLALSRHTLATDSDHVLSTPSPHVSNRYRSCSQHSLTTR
ncbi:hypothetical protein ElyMa_001877200 [Elysia marginata]|uniref:Uncharacterized protein n=1 Tax=Elysia marginata TaxID=1093978 RepID=A0AAV4EPJ9_9GAST|nr:hypothetical protein ElyMa_001877200 [Elysia marginata]